MTTMLDHPAATALPALRCPKCAAEMVTYERSGVVIDQCRECRGIYLDRGELEKLVDAEGAIGARGAATLHATGYPAPAPAAGYGTPAPAGGFGTPGPGAAHGGYRAEWHDHDDDDDRDDRRDWGGRRGWDDRREWDDDRRRPSRRRSLIGELLEGFGD